jgi:hypothetical protein
MDRLKYLTAEALMFDVHRPEMSQIIRCEMWYVRCEGRRVSIDTAHSCARALLAVRPDGLNGMNSCA